MTADEVIDALNKAEQALVALDGPEDETHLLNLARDGIVSALGYVRAWRQRADEQATAKVLDEANMTKRQEWKEWKCGECGYVNNTAICTKCGGIFT